jgi:aspartate 1-decarboxylase
LLRCNKGLLALYARDAALLWFLGFEASFLGRDDHASHHVEGEDVLNISTGGRFTTYTIEAPRGSREIAVNGAAARLVQTGDKVIIVAYCQLPAEEARNYRPSVVILGEGNEVEHAY